MKALFPMAGENRKRSGGYLRSDILDSNLLLLPRRTPSIRRVKSR